MGVVRPNVRIHSVLYTMNVQYCGNCNVNCSCVTSNLSAIVHLAAFGMYLLANNFVPLICFRIPLIVIIIMWIVMRILVLIVVITAIVLLLVYRCLSKTRLEKLLPRLALSTNTCTLTMMNKTIYRLKLSAPITTKYKHTVAHTCKSMYSGDVILLSVTVVVIILCYQYNNAC